MQDDTSGVWTVLLLTVASIAPDRLCAKQVLKGLEPYLQHALEVAEALKIEQRERMAGLEDAITGFCQVKAARAESSASATTSGEDTRGPTQMTGEASCTLWCLWTGPTYNEYNNK